MPSCLDEIYSDRILKDVLININSIFPDAENYSWPMIPYVGKNYDKANPKLLFVGKAPFGWGGDRKHFKDTSLREVISRKIPISIVRNETDRFIEKEVIPYYSGYEGYSSSRFMQRIYIISRFAFGQESQAEKILTSIAWTNLFKICRCNGELPPAKMKGYLLDNFNFLEREIDKLNPDIIIFSTGISAEYDKYLFGPNNYTFKNHEVKLEGVADGIARVLGIEADAFRTIHFQVIKRDMLYNLCRFIKPIPSNKKPKDIGIIFSLRNKILY